MKLIQLLIFISVQTELLIQAQLTRKSADLPPTLLGDFRRVLELAPRLLEELMKVVLQSVFILQVDFETEKWRIILLGH